MPFPGSKMLVGSTTLASVGKDKVPNFYLVGSAGRSFCFLRF